MTGPADVTIRLGVTGDADIKSSFDAIAASGDQSAQRLIDSYNRAGAEIDAMVAKQERTAAKILAIGSSPVQQRVDSLVSTGFSAGQTANARQWSQLLAEQEVRANALRAAIAPLWAAQQRYDAELRNANSLLAQGAISEAEHAAALGLAKRNLDAAGEAAARMGRTHQVSSVQTMMLQSAIFRTTESVAAGMPVWRIMIQQGTEVAAAVGMGGAGMGGAMSKVAVFMSGPWGLAVMAAGAGLAILATHFLDTGAAAKKSGDDIAAQANDAESLAKATDDMVKSLDRAIKSEQQLQVEALKSAEALRKKTVQTLQDAQANYRHALSEQASAQAALPAIGGEPGAGAIGFVMSAHIDSWKKEIDNLTANIAKQDAAVRTAKVPILDRQALDSVDAAKAVTDRYTATLDRLHEKYTSGTIKDESVYRAEVAKLTQARDRDLAAVKEHDKAAAGSSRADREAATAAREHARELASLQNRFDPVGAATRRYQETLLEIARSGLPQATKAVYLNAAALDYQREKVKALLPDIERMMAANPDAFGGKADDRKAADDQKFLDDHLRDQQEQLTLAKAEIALVGRTAVEQDKVIERLKLQSLFARQFGADVSKWPDAVRAAYDEMVKNSDAVIDAKANVDTLKASTNEFNETAGRELDNIFNVDNWKNWGDLGKSILKDLENEFIKLALLNPLKNALLGGDGSGSLLPTLGSVFHFDSGTEYAHGGMSYLAENGPELVDLPRGAKVHNASDTRRMLGKGSNDNAPVHIYDLRGAIVYEDLMRKIEARAQLAEARGANGGAQMARAQASRAQHFKLGGH